MPHLELNEPGWNRLVEDCHFHNIDDIAEMTGLAPAELMDVMRGSVYPDTRFIAACLGSLPATFNDLFIVKIPTASLVA